MTPREREIIYHFKAAQHLIPLASDGFPAPNECLGSMLGALGMMLLKVDMICHLGDTAEQQSLLRLTEATSRWIAATESGSRDPAIAEGRFKALAEAEQD